MRGRNSRFASDCLWIAELPMLLGLSIMPAFVNAESSSYTNAQLLYGGGFNDTLNGNYTADRAMNTLTLEHGGTWAYGDHYFFFDVTNGKFLDSSGAATGVTHRVYGEWFPRAGLSRITGKTWSWGPIKDVYLAGGMNVGSDGFYADLEGLSVDFDVPHVAMLGVSVFSRDDNLNRRTFQVSPFWSVPFKMGPLTLSFDGFMHVSGLDRDGPDVITEPQLLVDMTSFFHRLPKGAIMAGVEWYYHGNKQHATSAPQALLKWTW